MTQKLKRGIDYIGVGVGAAIKDNRGRFLLAKRGKKVKNEKGHWEIPGGALEFNERLADGLKREIKEELDVEIKVLELLHVADHLIPAEHQHWVSPTFICEIVSGEPKILEPEKCDEIGWFSLAEMEKMKLSIVTEQDLKILKKLDAETNSGCFVIVKNDEGKFLLGKRKNGYRAGEYGFPGGKNELDEKMEACAKRELLEEIGVKAKRITYLGIVKDYQENKKDFIHFVFLCNEWEGEIECREPEKCEGWKWFSLDGLPTKVLRGHLAGLDLLESKRILKEIIS